MSIAEQVENLETELAKWRSRATKAEGEINQLKCSRDSWRDDAKREATNSQYWRSKAEIAEAKVAELDRQLADYEHGELVRQTIDCIDQMATGNSSKTSDSSPSPAAEPASTSSDIVEELLDRFPYEWFYDVEAKRLSSGSVRLGSQIAPSIAIPLCTIVNRYRRIIRAVQKYTENDIGSIEAMRLIIAAVRPAKEDAANA